MQNSVDVTEQSSARVNIIANFRFRGPKHFYKNQRFVQYKLSPAVMLRGHMYMSFWQLHGKEVSDLTLCFKLKA